MKKINFKMTVLSLSLVALSLNVMGQKAPSISDTNLILNGSFEEGTWEYVNGTTTITGAPKKWNVLNGAYAIQNPVTKVYLLDKTADRTASITAMTSANVAYCGSLPATTDLLTPPDGNVIAVINNSFLMQNVTLPAGKYTFSGNYMRYVYTGNSGSGSGIYIYYTEGGSKVYTAADVALLAGETTLNQNGVNSAGTTQFNHWDSFSKQFTLTAETTVTVQIDLPGAHPGPWAGGLYAVDNLKLVSITTGVSTPEVNNGLTLSVNNSELIVNSPKKLNTTIYNMVGAKVKDLQLKAGYNTVSGLQRGIYIVDGQKVVIR